MNHYGPDLPFTPIHLTLALSRILPYSRLDTNSVVFNRIKDTTASLTSLLRPLHPPHDEGRPLSLHVLDFWNSAYEDIDVDLVRHPKQVRRLTYINTYIQAVFVDF
jgi:hypothetical protein